jgi:hypothetical protein
LTIDEGDVADIQLRLRGLDEVIAKFGRLQAEKMVEAGLYATAQTVYTDLRTYPPTLPNQRYRRTYKLRSGWYVIGNGLLFRVINDTNEYNREVQDRDQQRRIFQGRWPTWQGVVEARQGDLRTNVQRAVEARVSVF